VELDARITEEMRQYEHRRAATADSPGKVKLRLQGLI
jgi:hypothetical protein